MRIGQPKQQNWQNSETAENVTKELQTLLEGVQTTFSEKDKDEPKKPNYTSVAWVDDDTIAVVDKKNQKLKRGSSQGNKFTQGWVSMQINKGNHVSF